MRPWTRVYGTNVKVDSLFYNFKNRTIRMCNFYTGSTRILWMCARRFSRLLQSALNEIPSNVVSPDWLILLSHSDRRYWSTRRLCRLSFPFLFSNFFAVGSRHLRVVIPCRLMVGNSMMPHLVVSGSLTPGSHSGRGWKLKPSSANHPHGCNMIQSRTEILWTRPDLMAKRLDKKRMMKVICQSCIEKLWEFRAGSLQETRTMRVARNGRSDDERILPETRRWEADKGGELRRFQGQKLFRKLLERHTI